MHISSTTSTILNTLSLSLLLASTTTPILTAALTCNQGAPNTLTVSDINTLIFDLQNNNFNPPLQDPLPFADFFENGDNSQTFHLSGSSVSVTVTNDFVFQATHASLADIAAALEEWRDVCCGDFPTCISGATIVSGDTGIALDMTIDAA